ncbi:MAG: DUF2442 domain-containing protein [Thermoanaerobaculia bacterium]
MSFVISEENTPAPVAIEITDAELVVRLADGRTIVTPLVWYPTLLKATTAQRQNAVIGPIGIHWPEIDEDLSIAGMLAGIIPGYRWLNQEGRVGTTTS